MDTNTFSQQMKRLDDRFKGGKKTPDSTIRLYYDVLVNIPGYAFAEVVKRIIISERNYPTPEDLLQGWRIYQIEHAEKMISEVPETDCEYCNGFGGLDVTKDGYYKFLVRCGECDNWERTIPNKRIPRWTVKQIEDAGYWIHKPAPPKKRDIQRGAIKDMIEDAFENISDEDIPF